MLLEKRCMLFRKTEPYSKEKLPYFSVFACIWCLKCSLLCKKSAGTYFCKPGMQAVRRSNVPSCHAAYPVKTVPEKGMYGGISTGSCATGCTGEREKGGSDKGSLSEGRDGRSCFCIWVNVCGMKANFSFLSGIRVPYPGKHETGWRNREQVKKTGIFPIVVAKPDQKTEPLSGILLDGGSDPCLPYPGKRSCTRGGENGQRVSDTSRTPFGANAFPRISCTGIPVT